MAETLVELVARIKADSTELEKGLTDAERKTEVSSKNMSDSLKKVGMAMAASGAAITATLGLMGKAAIDEEINIKRLATTINNSGTAYDSVKDSLEAVISATQRKTGIADDEQRDILNRLILVTNDYNKALELMPTVLDLAAAGEMDATTAATYLGKAYLELEEGAEEVSVRFGQASLQFKSMEDIQNRVAGSAVNLANPLSVLSTSISDVAEVIGISLIPIIKSSVDSIVDIAIKVQDWIKENPELAKQITLIAGALGIFLGVVGTGILLVPKLIAAWQAFNLAFTATPWGAIITGIGLLIAAGILLWQNWDAVSHAFVDLWSLMKVGLYKAIDSMLAYLQYFLSWIPKIGDAINDARTSLQGLIKAENEYREALDEARAVSEDKSKSEQEGLAATTEAQYKLNNAIKKEIALQEELYKAARKGREGAEGVASFASEADRIAYAREARAWDERSRAALAAGKSEEAMFAGGQAAAMYDRLRNASGGIPIQGFAEGGVVPGSIGQPQLAMVHGGETIIPANESMGNIVVNFTQPVFFEREDSMNKFVDMIRKGIQRQDRLRFGGAYNGS